MKPSKLKKRLKREVTAHPGKAAVLGILCVVAVWFWVPLVWGWLAPSGVSEAPPAAQASSIPSLPGFGPSQATTENVAATPSVRDLSWTQLIEWAKQDPRTCPMPMATESGQAHATSSDDAAPEESPELAARNPFSAPASTQESTSAPEVTSAADLVARPRDVRPQDAGAAVSAVIASPTGGTAMINGRTYFLGEQVVLSKDNETYSYQLARIRPGGVILSRDGKQYELDIPLPANALRPAAQVDESARGPTP